MYFIYKTEHYKRMSPSSIYSSLKGQKHKVCVIKSSVAVREPCHSAYTNSVSITKNLTKAASEAFISQESSFV